MRRLVYLAVARRDLKAIHDFVSDSARDHRPADAIVRALRKQCTKLASVQTILGRARPDLRRNLRSIVFGRYLIFARYSKDKIEIVRILDGRRDIAAVFERELWYEQD